MNVLVDMQPLQETKVTVACGWFTFTFMYCTAAIKSKDLKYAYVAKNCPAGNGW